MWPCNCNKRTPPGIFGMTGVWHGPGPLARPQWLSYWSDEFTLILRNTSTISGVAHFANPKNTRLKYLYSHTGGWNTWSYHGRMLGIFVLFAFKAKHLFLPRECLHILIYWCSMNHWAFLQHRPWISPWIKSISNELDITFTRHVTIVGNHYALCGTHQPESTGLSVAALLFIWMV